MIGDISKKILEKISSETNDENEQKFIVELLEKTARYNNQTKPAEIKKEFQLLLEQYFPYSELKNEWWHKTRIDWNSKF